MIHWKMHEYHYTCKEHGSVPKTTSQKTMADGTVKEVTTTTVCPKCKDLPKADRFKVKAKYELKSKSAPIGVFMRDYYVPFINQKYRKHLFLVEVARRFIVHRNAIDILNGQPLSCIFVRDYTDRIGVEYNGASMGSGMGGGYGNVGMEGFYSCYRKNGDGDVTWHWNGYLSDEKQQDARTSYANAIKFITYLQDECGLLPRGGTAVLYIRSDGCPCQYKSATAIMMCIWLSVHFAIEIDWMITAPNHGKNSVDALAGKDKAHLQNGYLFGICNAARDAADKLLSEATKACKYLTEWYAGKTLPDTKHKYKEGQIKLSSRTYDVTNYDDADSKIPVKNCSFEIKDSQWNKGAAGVPNGNKQNKLKDMFHFRYHPCMGPAKKAAIRRMPCLCAACFEQLEMEWYVNQ